MKQEDKDLLLKDLCARLPYGIKISIPDLWTQKREIEILDEIFKGDDGLYRVNSSGQCIEHVKPYLFPLSSMTEEQEKEISKRYNYHNSYQLCVEITKHLEGYWDNDNSCDLQDYLWLIDYFYKNHIDFRGLIELGLAKDATGLNIY